jgi:hypothetical protein
MSNELANPYVKAVILGVLFSFAVEGCNRYFAGPAYDRIVQGTKSRRPVYSSPETMSSRLRSTKINPSKVSLNPLVGIAIDELVTKPVYNGLERSVNPEENEESLLRNIGDRVEEIDPIINTWNSGSTRKTTTQRIEEARASKRRESFYEWMFGKKEYSEGGC